MKFAPLILLAVAPSVAAIDKKEGVQSKKVQSVLKEVLPRLSKTLSSNADYLWKPMSDAEAATLPTSASVDSETTATSSLRASNEMTANTFGTASTACVNNPTSNCFMVLADFADNNCMEQDTTGPHYYRLNTCIPDVNQTTMAVQDYIRISYDADTYYMSWFNDKACLNQAGDAVAFGSVQDGCYTQSDGGGGTFQFYQPESVSSLSGVFASLYTTNAMCALGATTTPYYYVNVGMELGLTVKRADFNHPIMYSCANTNTGLKTNFKIAVKNNKYTVSQKSFSTVSVADLTNTTQCDLFADVASYERVICLGNPW